MMTFTYFSRGMCLRVVSADDFEMAAVSLLLRICGYDPVERPVLLAESRKPELDHHFALDVVDGKSPTVTCRDFRRETTVTRCDCCRRRLALFFIYILLIDCKAILMYNYKL